MAVNGMSASSLLETVKVLVFSLQGGVLFWVAAAWVDPEVERPSVSWAVVTQKTKREWKKEPSTESAKTAVNLSYAPHGLDRRFLRDESQSSYGV